MKLYDFKAIRDGVKISRYLADQQIAVRGNRAIAKWRGGDDYTVSFKDDEGVWFDHKDNRGGSIIDLAMAIEGITTPLAAMMALGDRYNIEFVKETRKPRKKTRGEMLVADGYALVKTYTYTDENGSPVYFVDRYEKQGAHKEFVQRTTTAESIEGVERLLYNLPAIIDAKDVYIVEGEKDADTMARLNLVATTNSGGGKFWSPDFNRHFAGKNVVIIPDNDETGRQHAATLYSNLKPVAASVRVAPPVSMIPKGDVTDYMEKEGGTIEGLMEKLNAATEPTNCISPEVAAAKLANETPLNNYTGTKKVAIPRRVDDLIDDMNRRFLNFPRRIGSTLFDYTRKDKKILPLVTKDDLKAWVDGTSGHQADFIGKAEFVSWNELYARLMQTVTNYNGIASAPWFPNRVDVFPIYDMLPTPDPTHSAFWKLVDFTNPATPTDRALIAAMFMAPMFYIEGEDKPAFIISTVDAQGSGKSSLVNKIMAPLYKEDPIDIELKTIEDDTVHAKKRILSTEGRAKRIALIDNVEGSIKGEAISKFITAKTYSGMAPYGRGEETRKNDITWVFTANGAFSDNDMTTRTYTLNIRKPPQTDPTWVGRVRDHIEANRLQIFADMLDMMATAKPRVRHDSRFAKFDEIVLSAVCASDEEFNAVDNAIIREATKNNEDTDRANEFIELLANAVGAFGESQTGIKAGIPLVIRMTDVDSILRRSTGQLRNWTARRIRTLIRGDKVPQAAKKFEQLPDKGEFIGYRQRSILIVPSATLRAPKEGEWFEFQVVHFDGPVPKAVLTDRMKL